MKTFAKLTPLAIAFLLSNLATANTNFATDNNTGRLAGVMGQGVPSEATTAEAVAMASMPTHAVINNTQAIQNVNPAVRIFGEQLFRGAFATTSGSTFNDSYVINVGDNVQVRMWGAYQYAATMTVDPQGNIFLPNVGPVRIAGIQNGQLQSVVQSAIARIYRSNVGVYASLEQAQPVKVFVTGFVNQPGYYGGLAADSVLSYLDRAGGIDPKRGSYIDVQILRGGQVVQKINLYDFLIMGRLSPFSFQDGDVINVASQKQTFSISGKVQNEYVFEFGVDDLTISDVLAVAKPLADATNISITRASGKAQTSEYYAINDAKSVPVNNGDTLVVTSDRHAGTIAVQVTGAHKGNGAVILPYGARLKDVIAQLEPSSLANVNNLTIYRESVKASQKTAINKTLDRLQEMTLATQSTTREEAQLRSEDAKLVEQFIAKARQIEPTGRIVVVPNSWQDIILEQGDIIHIPAKTSVITVNGQVRHQGALTFNADLTVGDYVAKSGGFDDNADTEQILVMHQNGETSVVNTAYRIQEGDEIMVLPKVKTRKVEIARGIAQVIYQLAVATGVIVKL
ncbi:MAG: polysaccharide biosynthesis/export family protein [Moraxella sp.]|uniref:polysaccharide biosynthesis/export family protein n=1 Tax=Moraxella sp. TaxID=479 RepID=UPI0026DD72CE|nr:polysaccharide biosynthesis/export family protein [Moraxella sp.]MDO4450708.1 polysaccharide biosynthesis/export family protein [Moraxella sp.]